VFTAIDNLAHLAIEIAGLSFKTKAPPLPHDPIPIRTYMMQTSDNQQNTLLFKLFPTVSTIRMNIVQGAPF
jgi:hypothetical protein